MPARLFLSFLILTACLTSQAAKIRLRSERVAISSDQLQGNVWDISTLAEIDSWAKASVGIGESGLIFENVRHGMTDIYLLRGDSIYFRGLTYGRDMGVLVDDTVAIASSTFSPISLDSHFTGEARFVSGRRGRVEGEVRTVTGNPGRFIFAPGDTIAAICLYERRISISDMPDPGLSGEVEFRRWYVPGSRLPFAVQYRQDEDDARLFVTANLPEEMVVAQAAPDPEEELQRVLSTTSIEISDSGVSVRFGADVHVHAEVSVFDASGHLYAFEECFTDCGEAVVIDTRHLMPGSYLAVVMLNGEPEFSIKKGFTR